MCCDRSLTTRCSGRTRLSRRLLKGASVAPGGAPLNAGVSGTDSKGVNKGDSFVRW